MRIFFYFLLFSVLIFSIFFTFKKGDFSKCKVAYLRINNFKVELDVASDDTKRRLGLMFVKELPKNKGMLFVFDKEEEHIFWMKNTYIPLDIIFLSRNLRINKIETLRASFFDEDEEKIPKVNGFGKYVIELKAGFSKEFGLKEGSRVDLECLKK